MPEADLASWKAFLDRLENAQEEVKIALVGKYVQLQDAYKSIREALSHAAAYNNRKLNLTSILSDDINEANVQQLADFQGIVIAPGFGNRGVEGKLQAIRFARENKIPCFGICMGMQCMAIEFARDVLGYEDANSTELEEHGLICSGINPDSGLTEIIELQDHPWFIGTQFHPEYSSTVLHPHPLFLSFIRTAIGI